MTMYSSNISYIILLEFLQIAATLCNFHCAKMIDIECQDLEFGIGLGFEYKFFTKHYMIQGAFKLERDVQVIPM